MVMQGTTRAVLKLACVGALVGASCASIRRPPETAAPPPSEGRASQDEASRPSPVQATQPSSAVPPLRLEPVAADASAGARKHNRAGLRLHRQGRYAEAATEFRHALRLDPGHALARYNLACAEARRGEGDSALALLEQFAAAWRAGTCGACGGRLRRAAVDPDLRSLSAHARFQAIIAAAPSAAAHAQPQAGPPSPQADVPPGMRLLFKCLDVLTMGLEDMATDPADLEEMGYEPFDLGAFVQGPVRLVEICAGCPGGRKVTTTTDVRRVGEILNMEHGGDSQTCFDDACCRYTDYGMFDAPDTEDIEAIRKDAGGRTMLRELCMRKVDEEHCAITQLELGPCCE